ncbi:hypothetical protein B0O99DRAFT_136516 [Bisporella sp. PMI_857]|nr:hypothetical protein B0O99DRAFT_136516 [Bisporella sp. PMI_857]
MNNATMMKITISRFLLVLERTLCVPCVTTALWLMPIGSIDTKRSWCLTLGISTTNTLVLVILVSCYCSNSTSPPNLIFLIPRSGSVDWHIIVPSTSFNDINHALYRSLRSIFCSICA